MNKSDNIEKNKDNTENLVQISKESCLIFKEVRFNSNASSKSNTECIKETKNSE